MPSFQHCKAQWKVQLHSGTRLRSSWAQDEFFTHRALEVVPIGQPESACLLNARGAALEALGLEGSIEREKVESFGAEV